MGASAAEAGMDDYPEVEAAKFTVFVSKVIINNALQRGDVAGARTNRSRKEARKI
jgi:hypothetical protein